MIENDYPVNLHPDSVLLNERSTVGVSSLDGLTTNETRRSVFDARYLKQWADLVASSRGDRRVEVIFTPGRPMVAVVADESDPTLGIGVAPRIQPDEDEDFRNE